VVSNASDEITADDMAAYERLAATTASGDADADSTREVVTEQRWTEAFAAAARRAIESEHKRDAA
jgi:hypothetical protein